jgi:lipopolysaccharide biosynthesis glycosyltransferase
MAKINEEKNIVPICFIWSGEKELMIPLGVCISSLLKNARRATFYDIFILHHDLKEPYINTINRLKEVYTNCNISYIDCKDAFSRSYKSRFAIANYYRLLLPDMITQYDKIICSDLDIIFECDLREIYQTSLQNNHLIAGVHIPEFYFDFESKAWEQHLKKLGCNKKYINAGFVIINSRAMRLENTVDKFKQHQNKKYLYLEQDIINIVCKDRIESIPIKYNYANDIYPCIYKYPMISNRSQESDIEYINKSGGGGGGGVKQKNGRNPWNFFFLGFDICFKF